MSIWRMLSLSLTAFILLNGPSKQDTNCEAVVVLHQVEWAWLLVEGLSVSAVVAEKWSSHREVESVSNDT
jgi:hypothetical protein